MSISYSKSVPVVFLVQEGDELPRAATAEDFLKAGFVPAASRFEEASTVKDEEQAADATPAHSKDEVKVDDDCPLTCDDCLFLGEDHILVELVTLPELIVDTLSEAFDNVKAFRLDDLKGHVDGLLDPFWFAESADTVETEKPASKEKTSPVEDFAGDLFTGAFSVFNTIKDGLSGLLDSVDSPEVAKPATKEETPAEPVAPEPVKEETPAEEEEKPEFSEFEQTVIKQFEEIGLGADAKSALRKSKEFSEFLSSKQPTPEQAKAFAEMLKNGKPPFFG